MGARGEVVARLVEADVAVVADAQQLQVHTAQAADQRVVARTLGVHVLGHAVGQVGGALGQVHMVKQIVVHEVVIALVVLPGQAQVFIQVHRAHTGKIHIALVVPVHQLHIRAHRAGTGGQAQHAVRLQDDLGRNQVGGLAAHIRIVFGAKDLQHTCRSFCFGPGRAAERRLYTLPISIFHCRKLFSVCICPFSTFFCTKRLRAAKSHRMSISVQIKRRNAACRARNAQRPSGRQTSFRRSLF